MELPAKSSFPLALHRLLSPFDALPSSLPLSLILHLPYRPLPCAYMSSTPISFGTLAGPLPPDFTGEGPVTADAFIRHFQFYVDLNPAHPLVTSPYTCAILALSYIHGPLVAVWTRMTKVQVQALLLPPRSLSQSDELLWDTFETAFRVAFGGLFATPPFSLGPASAMGKCPVSVKTPLSSTGSVSGIAVSSPLAAPTGSSPPTAPVKSKSPPSMPCLRRQQIAVYNNKFDNYLVHKGWSHDAQTTIDVYKEGLSSALKNSLSSLRPIPKSLSAWQRAAERTVQMTDTPFDMNIDPAYDHDPYYNPHAPTFHPIAPHPSYASVLEESSPAPTPPFLEGTPAHVSSPSFSPTPDSTPEVPALRYGTSNFPPPPAAFIPAPSDPAPSTPVPMAVDIVRMQRHTFLTRYPSIQQHLGATGQCPSCLSPHKCTIPCCYKPFDKWAIESLLRCCYSPQSSPTVKRTYPPSRPPPATPHALCKQPPPQSTPPPRVSSPQQCQVECIIQQIRDRRC